MAKARVGDDEEDGQKDRFFVLLRHGMAEDIVDGKSDEERSLTPEGHARMKQIARGLEEAFPKAQAIYSSPLRRAVQTALWIAKGYRSRVKVNTVEALLPDAAREDFRKFIDNIQERRVIIVGHEPTLTHGLLELTGINGGSVSLQKGGGYGVRVRSSGEGVLEWLLSPRILRKLGEAD